MWGKTSVKRYLVKNLGGAKIRSKNANNKTNIT